MPRDPKTGFLTPGRISPLRSVPAGIARPEYVGKVSPTRHTKGDVYDQVAIEKIRAAGRIAARAIDLAGAASVAGATTDSIDALVHDYVVSQGAYPSTLGYRGFPKSCCTSLNEVICHGIPDDTVLQDGDIINIDVTAYLDGYHGDSNKTFIVGEVSPEVASLVENTRTALQRGMQAVAAGRPVNVIGRAIESYAKRFGYGVIRDFTGHGVGESFHSGLVIPHYDSAPLFDTEIVDHMVFTIEPMLTLGGHEWEMWEDGWTVVTKDRSITAQFEHTMAVTADGVDILTLAD